jgi:NTP pyrophosphatase (non-canonical NTP hydrolase)
MDTKEVMTEIDETPRLQELYCTINDTTNRFEKLQKDTKLKEKNNESIEKCLDIECNFSRKTNTDHLSVLIKDYREVNKLDIHDTVENLIKAINVEAGELLETTNFGKVIDPKKVEEELADVLIYCFSLASKLNTPVDRIIARKIKKNIERGRQYD